MKNRSYSRVVTLNYLFGFGCATITSAVVFGFIFGVGVSIVAVLSLSMLAAVTASALEELLENKEADDMIASSKKPIKFKLVSNNNRITLYGKKGLFWVFVAGGFEDVYKAQEYITSIRETQSRKRNQEIGRFKA